MKEHVKCESITIYTWLGEENGAARWQVTRMDGVAVFRRGGVRQHPLQSLRGDDRAVLYIFEEQLRPRRRYVEAEAFAALKAAERDGAWTVREDGRDRVYLGLCWDARPPEGSAKVVRPVGVVVNGQGRRGMRHVKVTCA